MNYSDLLLFIGIAYVICMIIAIVVVTSVYVLTTRKINKAMDVEKEQFVKEFLDNLKRAEKELDQKNMKL